MSNPESVTQPRRSAANTLGLNYESEAARLGAPVVPIIDSHTHISGADSSRIYDKVRKQWGVKLTYSMTQLERVDPVLDVLGDSIRFIAFPSFFTDDKNAAHRSAYLQRIETFASRYGSRLLKIWNSPRLRDLVPDLAGTFAGATDLAEVDSHWRIETCKLGEQLGMMYMIHIADPDTWFARKYTDAKKYGTKAFQYEGLERMLDRFANPWIAAHMGGWPEDLTFLDGLLTRHPNLYLDTSATKWAVRELSRHPKHQVVAFFTKWSGRLLFGSDLVVMEDQLRPQKTQGSPMSDLADSPESAAELYASRYWALRTMFETDYDGPSSISDPDLNMMEPEKYDKMAAPRLQGLALPKPLLKTLYAGASEALLGKWWSTPR